MRDVQQAYYGLCVNAGKQVLAAMMEADRVALCGAKNVPDTERMAVQRHRSRTQGRVASCMRSRHPVAFNRPRDIAVEAERTQNKRRKSLQFTGCRELVFQQVVDSKGLFIVGTGVA